MIADVAVHGAVHSSKHHPEGTATELVDPGAEPVHRNRAEARLRPVAEVDPQIFAE